MEVKAEKKSAEVDQTTEYNYQIEKFAALTGKFELEDVPGFIITFKRDGDIISAQPKGQPAVDLTPQSDSLFNLQGTNVRITFHIKKIVLQIH